LVFCYDLTDACAAWLVDPATGFQALTSLKLVGSDVTDAGLTALAAQDTASRPSPR